MYVFCDHVPCVCQGEIKEVTYLRSSVMIATRRLNDEQDSHCIVRGNRLTARMQDCEEMTNCIFNAFLLCVSIETRQFF